jgi:hypothetical protein
MLNSSVEFIRGAFAGFMKIVSYPSAAVIFSYKLRRPLRLLPFRERCDVVAAANKNRLRLVRHLLKYLICREVKCVQTGGVRWKRAIRHAGVSVSMDFSLCYL